MGQFETVGSGSKMEHGIYYQYIIYSQIYINVIKYSCPDANPNQRSTMLFLLLLNRKALFKNGNGSRRETYIIIEPLAGTRKLLHRR